LTVFEALAMGKPIVATDADGLLDVLHDGRDALIVPRNDARRLTDAICELIERPEKAACLAVEARQTGARYDIAAFVRKMERLYEILHGASAGRRRLAVRDADLGFLTTARG
jgi:phosphatidyl-myo-inositol alpha-mannosyltransferase